MNEPPKKDEPARKPPPRCPICGCGGYGSYQDHYWCCPRAERAIENDRDKERV